MKTKIFALLALICAFTFTSCSKDDDNSSFDYSLETLYGTWDGIAIKTTTESNWMDITKYPYTKFEFGIKFNKDNTYYGFGYFGNGSGTYTAIGKRITTYIDGEEYLYYDVRLLSSTEAEATMRKKGSDSYIDIKLRKR